MTQITAVNSTDQSAKLTISKGGGDKAQPLTGAIDLAAEAVVIVPPVWTYTIHASAMIQGGAWCTNTVSAPQGGWRLAAGIETTGEVLSFQLSCEPGEVPDQFVLTSTVDAPTTFTITAHPAGAPGQVVLSADTVVQPKDLARVGLDDAYAFHAVVDGLVTQTVQTDPARPGQDITVQIVAQTTDGGDAAYGLVLVAPAAKTGG